MKEKITSNLMKLQSEVFGSNKKKMENDQEKLLDDSHYNSQPSNLTGYKHHSYITSNQGEKNGDMDFQNIDESPEFGA